MSEVDLTGASPVDLDRLFLEGTYSTLKLGLTAFNVLAVELQSDGKSGVGFHCPGCGEFREVVVPSYLQLCVECEVWRLLVADSEPSKPAKRRRKAK